MPANTGKQLIDTGLSAITTGCFAFGPAGVAAAAAIGVVKSLFDAFYQPTNRTDPAAALVTLGSLDVELAKVEAHVDKAIWSAFESGYLADGLGENARLTSAIHAAGKPSTDTDRPGIMPGDTIVWTNKKVDLWNPVLGNPSPLLRTLYWVKTNPTARYASYGLYTFAAGVYLTYCNTAVAFELNENLKDYYAQRDAYNTYVRTNSKPPSWPKPAKPMDGDGAVGSQNLDAQGNLIDYQSHIGQKKSKFAELAAQMILEAHPYLVALLADLNADLAARDAAVKNRMADFSLQTVPQGGQTYYQYVDAKGLVGPGSITTKTLATSEMSVAKGQERRAIWDSMTTSKSLDEVVDGDVDKIGKCIKQLEAGWDAYDGDTHTGKPLPNRVTTPGQASTG